MKQFFSKALAIDKAIADAKRSVDQEPPFSPAWDAAMAMLEDAERVRWELERKASRPVGAAASPTSSEEPAPRASVQR
jgi:hypothetical protein